VVSAEKSGAMSPMCNVMPELQVVHSHRLCRRSAVSALIRVKAAVVVRALGSPRRR